MHAERADEARPNLFVNTPDILHESLQTGGRGMFAIRATLAATMSPTWGVYSGFELYEGEPVKPGSEEYLNSEKYELRPRDFAAAAATGNSLEPYLTRLNEIRRAHPALQQLRDIHFHQVDNDAAHRLLQDRPGHRRHRARGAARSTRATRRRAPPRSTCRRSAWTGTTGSRCTTRSAGETYDWGQFNYVRLEPWPTWRTSSAWSAERPARPTARERYPAIDTSARRPRRAIAAPGRRRSSGATTRQRTRRSAVVPRVTVLHPARALWRAHAR